MLFVNGTSFRVLRFHEAAEVEKKARSMQISETKQISRNVTETGGRFHSNENKKLNRTESA